MAAEDLRALARAALALARPTPSFRVALAALRPPPELVGETLGREAAAAAADVRAFDARKALRRVDELEDVSPDPVAVTPTSQVHRAVLDGAPVAVKVRRAGVAEAVRTDLRIVDALARPLGTALPAVDVTRLLAEARERVGEELDLEHEGDATRRMARALRSHPEFTVPMPVSRLTSEDVLVMEWIEGAPPTAADAPAILRFFVGSARAGLVHAEPHVDHVLRTADGRLAVLDAGASRRVDAGRVDLAVAALDALAGDDGAALGRVLESLGWLPAGDGPEALALAREIGAELLGGEATLDLALLVTMRDRALARLDRIAALAARTTVPPEDLWPLRMLGGLALTLGALGGRGDWVALAREAAVTGWD
jgi:hypothetical protein